jgi:hypothetical protein
MTEFLNSRKGIKNLRNTCFMNSVFQCLISIEDIRTFFKNTKREENGMIFDMFKDLMESFESKNCILEPRELIESCYGLFPGAQPHSQQDAQEFFLLLVQELSKVLVIRKEEDIFNKIFYWKISYRIYCRELNEVKELVEDTFQLRLPIKDISNKVFDWRSPNEIEFLLNKSNSMFCKVFRDMKPLTINDCINNFFMNYEETVLDTCQYCRKFGCTQKIDILEYPKYIIFHLERLQIRKKIVKINKRVYPLIDIKIGPSEENYRLISSIEHTSFFGKSHYFVYCSEEGTWFKCDDSKVIQVSEEKVINSQPYLLIYKKVSETKAKQEKMSEKQNKCKEKLEENLKEEVSNLSFQNLSRDQIDASNISKSQNYDAQSSINHRKKENSQTNILENQYKNLYFTENRSQSIDLKPSSRLSQIFPFEFQSSGSNNFKQESTNKKKSLKDYHDSEESKEDFSRNFSEKMIKPKKVGSENPSIIHLTSPISNSQSSLQSKKFETNFEETYNKNHSENKINSKNNYSSIDPEPEVSPSNNNPKSSKQFPKPIVQSSKIFKTN